MRFTPGKQILRKPGAPAEPLLPPIRNQAANALQAASRAVRAIATGQALWLTPAKREEHQAICRSNQCGFFRESDQRCAHPRCGCFTRLKTLLATEDCPAGLFKRGA